MAACGEIVGIRRYGIQAVHGRVAAADGADGGCGDDGFDARAFFRLHHHVHQIVGIEHDDLLFAVGGNRQDGVVFKVAVDGNAALVGSDCVVNRGEADDVPAFGFDVGGKGFGRAGRFGGGQEIDDNRTRVPRRFVIHADAVFALRQGVLRVVGEVFSEIEFRIVDFQAHGRGSLDDDGFFPRQVNLALPMQLQVFAFDFFVSVNKVKGDLRHFAAAADVFRLPFIGVAELERPGSDNGRTAFNGRTVFFAARCGKQDSGEEDGGERCFHDGTFRGKKRGGSLKKRGGGGKTKMIGQPENYRAASNTIACASIASSRPR